MTHQSLQTQMTTVNQVEKCLDIVKNALNDLKAKNITVLDVADLTEMMDVMVIAEGTSNRHLKALAQHVATQAKQAGFMPLGIEGQGTTDWTLIDLDSIVVHVMMPQARAFYDLEGLWQNPTKQKI